MKKLKYILLLSLFAVFTVSCKTTPAEDSVEAEDHDHHDDEDSNFVSLTEGQIKAVEMEFGEIEAKELKNVIKANGNLKVPNQSKAEITSLYSGQIKSLNVRPGGYVGKGQIVAVIENPQQILIQEQYLTVLGQIQMAQTEVTRQQQLYDANAGALKNLQYAQSQLKTLQTQKVSLAKQLNIMGINPGSVSASNLRSTMTVKSPISGTVSSVLAQIGTYVDVSFPIAEVVNNENLHLDLNVFEKDLPKVKVDQLIHFTLTNNPVKEYDARIYSIGSAFEGESKAVTVHAQVLGDKTGLIEGMNVVGIISIGESLVPAVPTEAIVNSGEEDFIFYEKERHDEEVVFEKVPVAKGVTDVGYSQVTLLNPIPDKAKIVTKGAFFLMAKMNNTGEGHHH